MLKRGFFLKSSESSGYFAYQKCLNSSFAVFFIPFGILWKDWFLNSQYKCIPWGNWVLCLRTTMEQQDEFKICVQQQEQYYLFKVIPYNSFLTWGFNMKNLNFISPTVCTIPNWKHWPQKLIYEQGRKPFKFWNLSGNFFYQLLCQH